MFKIGDKVVCVSVPDGRELGIYPSKYLKIHQVYDVNDETQDIIGITFDNYTWYFLNKNFVLSIDLKSQIAASILSGDIFKT